MKVIVAGSQNINDKDKVFYWLDNCMFDITEVVSGGAKGPDSFGVMWAKQRGIAYKMMRPDWSIGPHAGMVRNHAMGDYGDALMAFWDNESPGTKDMIEYMRKIQKPVRCIPCLISGEKTLLEQLLGE